MTLCLEEPNFVHPSSRLSDNLKSVTECINHNSLLGKYTWASVLISPVNLCCIIIIIDLVLSYQEISKVIADGCGLCAITVVLQCIRT